MKKILALLVTFLLAGSVFAGEYPDVSIDELNKAIKAGKVTVIDVNSAKSYQKGHIPTAVAYNPQNLKKALPKDKNALVVAYCGGPACKAYKRAADAASKLGYTNVRHLSAGISGWKRAGQPTEAAK